jgi:hypothetical protein
LLLHGEHRDAVLDAVLDDRAGLSPLARMSHWQSKRETGVWLCALDVAASVIHACLRWPGVEQAPVVQLVQMCDPPLRHALLAHVFGNQHPRHYSWSTPTSTLTFLAACARFRVIHDLAYLFFEGASILESTFHQLEVRL